MTRGSSRAASRGTPIARIALVVAWVAFLARAAVAEDSRPANSPTLWTVGAGYGTPARLSGTAGLLATVVHRRNDPEALLVGVAGEAQVGQGGWGLRLGLDLLPRRPETFSQV